MKYVITDNVNGYVTGPFKSYREALAYRIKMAPNTYMPIVELRKPEK
jgi:hypothetical protein